MMNEFLTQIKSNAEMGAIFEGIQRDVTNSSETSLMDIS